MGEGIQIPLNASGNLAEKIQEAKVYVDVFAAGAKTSLASLHEAQLKSSSTWTELKSKIDLATGAIRQVAGAAQSLVALTAEQQRLDGASVRLGLDLNAAADAAGRFTDETDVMTAASRFAEAGFRLTQGEMDALSRRAGQLSQNLGMDTTQAFERLYAAVVAGEQEALRPFGQELTRLGGTAGTAQQRLAVLVRQARELPQATDNAATSMARLQDAIGDAQRTIASGFVGQLTAIVTAERQLAEHSATAADSTEEMTTTLRGMGSALASAAMGLAGFGQMLVGTFSAPLGIMTTVASAWASLISGNPREALATLRSGSGAARFAMGQLSQGSQRFYGGIFGSQADTLASENEIRTRSSTEDRRLGSQAAAQASSLERSTAMTFTDAEVNRRRGGGGGRGRVMASASENARRNAERVGEWRMLADTYSALVGGAYMSVSDFQELAGGDIERGRSLLSAARESANAAADRRFYSGTPSATTALEGRRRAADSRLAQRNALAQIEEQGGLQAQGRSLFGFENEGARDPDAAERARATNRLSSLKSFAATAKEAWDGIGGAIADNLTKLSAGEQSFTESIKNIGRESLKALGTLAIKKGIFYTLEGVASLLFAPAAAANYFAAGAGMTALGIGLVAGAGAAATKPGAASAGGGGGAPASVGSGSSGGGSQGPSPVVVNNYYSPVIGNREATSSDVGDAVESYRRAARPRRDRS